LLYYNERVKLHPDNHEEIQSRCQLIYEELTRQKVSFCAKYYSYLDSWL